MSRVLLKRYSSVTVLRVFVGRLSSRFPVAGLLSPELVAPGLREHARLMVEAGKEED